LCKTREFMKKYFHHRGKKIFYSDEGSGKPVVLVHGYLETGDSWKSFSQRLSSFRVLTIDLPGHGASDILSEVHTMELMAETINGLLNATAIEKACVIGHSMGGFIALQLVLDHPELVKALVLVDTSSGEFETPPEYAELRAKLDELARDEGLAAAFEYDAENNPMRIERFQKHPELREVARQKVMNTSVDGYIYVARTFRKWQPVTDRLHEIEVPTLIFWGEEDTPFLKASQIMEDSIKNAELITVPGVGHSPHEEAPDRFNEALSNFLNRVRWT